MEDNGLVPLFYVAHHKWKFVMSPLLLMLFLLSPLASPFSTEEGKALMAMKASFSNIADVLLDWDDVHNDDFCSWRGVFCDNVSLTVVSLNLSSLNLGGEISPAIGDLGNLQSIDLQGNKLTGQIPDEIGNCAALAHLDLSDNQLYGDIPFSLSKLKQLEFLNLKSNQLTGPIPSTLTQIPNLKTLDLARNRLTGEIPRLLYWNEVLQYLGLRGNLLSGTLSPDICQLTGLWYFDVRGNNLTGTIPDSIGNCTSFEILDISYNQITGEIPYNIGFLQVATLSLQGNRLTGRIPEVIGLMLLLNIHCVTFSSFIGNPFLCGNWFGSICGPSVPKSREIFSRVAVVCLTLGIMMLLAMVIVAFYRSSQSKQLMKGSSRTGQGPPKLVVLHMDMAIHTLDDIMRSTENLNEKYVIGYGASSTVYKCALKNSRPIAIKRLYNQQPHNFREFETELETIGNIRHRNLVTLHGYALTPNGNLLFYDYMANGSLWDLLHGPLKVKLDWETRLRIAVGAAEGLAYLHHDCNPRIVHRDIKSSNILLDENFEAHLSDFGTAKCISTTRTHASTYVLGTIGYIDPEYARTSRLNEKSDVYSFGIVLLELLTGKKAVDNDSNLHQLILSKADNNTVMEAVDPEVSVTCIDLSHVKKTFQLALLCTKGNPSERPTMHEVVRVLVSLLPSPPSKILAPPAKKFDYAHYVIEKGQQRKEEARQPQEDNNSSNAQWFVRFGDVISKST
ncbi:LRR receptor-like serine/threonine-protein kinase ERL1 [Cajanus cajan]|uniref:LRR receptor-like serine/threonine-protein kinase ERL1 n=1 Tax=Cajanus cajan TaxID=3821 RepID=UPI00098DB38A|nr:LRR receptor-like serine/threonine-protein kinase ERL1 [Cajanus cajan]